MRIKTLATAHHRNGVAGAPFDVILFKEYGQGAGRKVGIVFDEPGYCAVLDIDLLAAGDIAFASNSWRGDNYEPYLRQALADPPQAAWTVKPPADKPAIAVVSIRGGLVEEVRANHKLHVLVEDWNGTEVRPSHDPIVPEPMLPGEEAELTDFFQPATNEGD